MEERYESLIHRCRRVRYAEKCLQARRITRVICIKILETGVLSTVLYRAYGRSENSLLASPRHRCTVAALSLFHARKSPQLTLGCLPLLCTPSVISILKAAQAQAQAQVLCIAGKPKPADAD